MSLKSFNKYLQSLGLSDPFKYDPRDKETNTRHKVAYMLNRTQGMFEYKGLPDTIPARDLELLEQVNGFTCVADVAGKLYAFFGGLGGAPNPYYMPTICTVSNPALNFNKALKIDEDCIVIPNDSLYQGLIPIMTYYATQLAENELSLYIGMINTRMLALISANDDKYKAAGDKYFSDLESGKLGFIAEKDFQNSLKTQPYGSAGSTDQLMNLLTVEQFLTGRFYNEMGIDYNPNMKRTVTTSEELNKNKQSLVPLSVDMLKQRQIGWDKVNAKYGTHVEVDLSDTWKRNLENALETDEEKEVDIDGTE